MLWFAVCGRLKRPRPQHRGKTAEATRQEVVREIDQFLCVVFSGQRKTGHLDLEADETTVRSVMHRAGSAAVTELLQFATPAADQERETENIST